MTYRTKIIEVITEVWADFVEGIDMPIWTDDVELLESGMDSLAFAVVVTELEDRLEFDPFTESDTPYYPVTFGDFVAFYDQFSRDP